MSDYGLIPSDERNQVQCAGTPSARYIPPTLRKMLTAQKDELEKRLADVNAALAGLDENPGAEKLMDLIRKVT